MARAAYKSRHVSARHVHAHGFVHQTHTGRPYELYLYYQWAVYNHPATTENHHFRVLVVHLVIHLAAFFRRRRGTSQSPQGRQAP